MRKLLIKGGRLIDPDTRTDERLDLLIVDGVVAQRAPELTPDVADSERSVILEQVTNGVAVRMSIIYLISRVRAAERAEELELLEVEL